MSKPVVIIPMAIHAACLAWMAKLVQHNVPQPYMDEIFHIPQAQRYCLGDYATWDPKLTTPPGLYIISHGLFLLGRVVGLNLCDVNSLRMVNLVFAVGLYPVIYGLLTQLHQTTSTLSRALYALALCWFPVGYFFNFVYYTDTASTFFVLLSYLFVLQHCYALAALMGTIAMTFRQTNVIWLAFFMVLSIIDIVSAQPKKKDSGSTLYNPLWSDNTSIVDIVRALWSLMVETWRSFPAIAPRIFLFMMALVSFAVFLVWNNGIVLGDRSNHIAGLHFPQLFYFSSFLSFFLLPWTLKVTSISTCLRCFAHDRLRSLLTASIMVYFVYYFTYEHPFLLSDNRHYSFYVWKNIYRRHWSIRYLLVPVYMVSGWLNMVHLRRHATILFMVGYGCVIILTLIPSPLLEFRYFILPFMFYTLHLAPAYRGRRFILGLSMYLILNGLTMYMFLYRPFRWDSVPQEWQRFMW
ncbi:alpha-2-glucosyltransferase Alg10 [Radiomyces spectabilis]|uniref:alpha-2-glucosyltransferase Alg10 n=1 Tax=Radiomyces spectabilis TaxID=64574 RepID=UPI00221EE162|nr:alpha-2-glucosyltransferase Alg10 [Radiomyces spectabilis]KAI8394183.1 alpha-2-glucosyltransferase Alg10 [Radiomyces spectabilis]